MAKQRTASPSRTMKPVFLIFCEGETEEAYLDYLKQAYRSPIRIVPKIEGDSISQRLIDVRKKELKIPDEGLSRFFNLRARSVASIRFFHKKAF